MVKTPKFHLNAHKFRQNYSNLVKLAFWIALVKTLRKMYNLTGFSDVRIFSLFLVMTSLSRHFLSHGCEICIFCEIC